jgi:hypothetical protein
LNLHFCFFLGHDFSRAAKAPKRESALAAAELKWLTKKYRRGCGKLGVVGENDGESPPAAEAGIDSEGVMRGLKPPPPSGVSFSAACEAHIDLIALAA